MKINLESNQSTFDVAMMLQGELDNMLIDIMAKYSFTTLDQNLTNVVIDATYNTDNDFVNTIFVANRMVVTSVAGAQREIHYGSFSDGFSDGFEIYIV